VLVKNDYSPLNICIYQFDRCQGETPAHESVMAGTGCSSPFYLTYTHSDSAAESYLKHLVKLISWKSHSSFLRIYPPFMNPEFDYVILS
jgi:hypothetical protein